MPPPSFAPLIISSSSLSSVSPSALIFQPSSLIISSSSPSSVSLQNSPFSVHHFVLLPVLRVPLSSHLSAFIPHHFVLLPVLRVPLSSHLSSFIPHYFVLLPVFCFPSEFAVQRSSFIISSSSPSSVSPSALIFQPSSLTLSFFICMLAKCRHLTEGRENPFSKSESWGWF
jgi:hypothetical protein